MRIALLATGGTIACRQTPDGLSPALHAEELAKSISCRDGVTLLPVDVFSMDSSNIQPEEWTQLAHAVDRAMQTCDGVVITHGTDTMGYTAAALSYMLLGQMKRRADDERHGDSTGIHDKNVLQTQSKKARDRILLLDGIRRIGIGHSLSSQRTGSGAVGGILAS